MGESDLHRDVMVDLIEAPRHHLSEQPQVYVSGNILFYYEEGNPHAHHSPDVLATLGVEKKRRESYKLWEIGKAPEVVVEVTSFSTRMRDVGLKKGIYEAVGVKEYILFDPRNEYLMPRFQVYRLESGVFVPCLVPEHVGYPSLLDLTFRVVSGVLRIFESESGQILPTPAELTARLLEEVQKVEMERRQAESERQRANRLAEHLRQLGVDPDSLQG